jgi:hypothetical protein
LAAFSAAVFLAAGRLVADFLLAVFLAAGRRVADFLLAVFFGACLAARFVATATVITSNDRTT